MKIIKNPNKLIWDSVSLAVKNNDGYCPCALERAKDTICPCREFMETSTCGECHCGRYLKVEN